MYKFHLGDIVKFNALGRINFPRKVSFKGKVSKPSWHHDFLVMELPRKTSGNFYAFKEIHLRKID